MFEVASELDTAFQMRGADWRALIARVRQACTTCRLYVAANAGTLENIIFWDALDAVGVDAYFSLAAATNGSALPLGQAPAVPALVDA